MILTLILTLVGVFLCVLSVYITVQAPLLVRNINHIDNIRRPLNLNHTQMRDVLGGLNAVEYAKLYYIGVSHYYTDLICRIDVLKSIVTQLEELQTVVPGYQLIYDLKPPFYKEQVSLPVTSQLKDLYAIDYHLEKELNRYIGGTN